MMQLPAIRAAVTHACRCAQAAHLCHPQVLAPFLTSSRMLQFCPYTRCFTRGSARVQALVHVCAGAGAPCTSHPWRFPGVMTKQIINCAHKQASNEQHQPRAKSLLLAREALLARCARSSSRASNKVPSKAHPRRHTYTLSQLKHAYCQVHVGKAVHAVGRMRPMAPEGCVLSKSPSIALSRSKSSRGARAPRLRS